MAEIQFTKEEVSQAQEFMLQFLRDSGYEGSLEDGTGAYDVLIKAFSILFALFKQQSNKAAGYLSLTKAEEYKDLLGDEYDTAIDSILSNWFVSRKEGTPSTGTLRLWFTKAQDFLQLKTGEDLFIYGSDIYHVVREYVFSPTDFNLVLNKARNREEYYVDVEVTSTVNSTTKPEAEETFEHKINNIYLIRAEVIEDFTPGLAKEPAEDFVARTQQAITTREMITDRAINTVLQEEFNNILSVYTAGFNSSEQIRDVVNYQDITLHVGNKADIYLHTKFTKTTYTYIIEEDSIIRLTGLEDLNHVAQILGVSYYNDELEQDVALPYTVTCDEKSWLTKESKAVLNVPSASIGDEITITYLSSGLVPTVTDYVTSEMCRVACYDPFVKSAHPILLFFSLQVSLKTKTLDEVSDEIKKQIILFVDSLGKAEPFTESNFIKHLHSTISDLESVSMPMNNTYIMFDEATSSNLSGNLPTNFMLPGAVTKSRQISENTVKFYTDSDFINITIA